MKPTVESILKSFRDSGKRHLILTGSRGSGKTTRFCEIIGDALPGITTYAVPRSHVVLQENLTRSNCVIGRFNGTTMEPTEELDSVASCIIERATEHSSQWFALDELGYLESHSVVFQRAIYEVFARKRVIAVVRKQDTEFLNSILSRTDVHVVDLDEAHMKVGCVIMASGVSKRYGSNKLLEKFHGITLLERVLDTTEGLFDGRVVVTRSEEVAIVCRKRGVDVVLHMYPNRNDTVRLGTEYLREMDALVFCPCDQPLLSRESLKDMLTWPWIHENEILRVAWEETVGTPILFGRCYYDELCTLPEKGGGGYLARQYPNRVKNVPVRDVWELFDVDTPADLEKLNEQTTPQN